MKVRFRTNLGSRDAAKFELDYAKCTVGAELEVSEKVAHGLEARGFAEITEKKKTVKAVPEKSSIAESKKSSIAGDKEEKSSDK